MYAGLQIFIQLSATLTKLCHIKRDHHYMLKMCTIGRNVHWVVALKTKARLIGYNVVRYRLTPDIYHRHLL